MGFQGNRYYLPALKKYYIDYQYMNINNKNKIH